MHEWALAEGVIETVIQSVNAAEKNKVREVVVAVGQLQQIRRETFEFSLREMMPENPVLADTRFVVEIEPAQFCCRRCQHPFGFEAIAEAFGEDEGEAVHLIPELAHAFARCPSCGSADFDVQSGRGVRVTSITAE